MQQTRSSELVRVIDTETTGLAADDQIIELAAVMVGAEHDDHDVTGMEGVVAYWHRLAVPTVPIKLEAMATHHIIPDMLEDENSLSLEHLHAVTTNATAAMSPWSSWPLRSTVMAAHNLEFDVKMLLQSGWTEEDLPERRICTYRCARHIWPDAPSHKNQVLRYYLGIWHVAHCDPPHRALPDAMVTSQILVRMLQTHTVDQLVQLTKEPIPVSICKFGKPYRGKLWKDVPTGYLLWMSRLTDIDDDLRYNVQRELRRRQ